MRLDRPALTGPATPKERREGSEDFPRDQHLFDLSSHCPTPHPRARRPSVSTRVPPWCRCPLGIRSRGPPSSTAPSQRLAARRSRRLARARRSQLRNFATAFRASRDAVRAPNTNTTTILALATNSEDEHPRAARARRDRSGDRREDHAPEPSARKHQGQHWSPVREQDELEIVESCPIGARGRETIRSRAGPQDLPEDQDENQESADEDIEKQTENVKTPSAPATSVPSVDVLAYTAYNDDASDGIERAASGPGKNPDRPIGPARTIDPTDFPISTTPCDRHCAQKSSVGTIELCLSRQDSSWTKRVFGSNERRDFQHDGERSTWDENTARPQQPITEASAGRAEGCVYRVAAGADGGGRSCGIKGPTRKLRPRRKRGLLFILYLLAWPLLCTTNPSGQFAAAFAQKPSLNHGDSLAQRNATILGQYSSHLPPAIAQHRSADVEPDGHHYHHRDERQDQPKQQSTSKQQQQHYQHHANDEPLLQEEREQSDAVGSEAHQGAVEAESAHPYNEYTWEVNQVNPWLSACDLAGPAPADLQGSCGPPEVPKNCPAACESKSRTAGDDLEFHGVIGSLSIGGDGSSRKTSRASQGSPVHSDGSSSFNDGGGRRQAESNQERNRMQGDRGDPDAGVRTAPEQCLFYLEESHKKDVCRVDFGQTSTRSFLTPRENRYRFMSGLRLRHCCEHAVVNALAPGKGGPLEDVLNGGQKCADTLDKLLLVDKLAARLHCEFEEVLARYDCAQPYSVIHNCTHCKEAYRKWVCSSLVPYFAHRDPKDLEKLKGWTGSRLRPCRSFCQSVEQRCPYLLPGDRAPAYPTQYAGEPTFLCRDPNIPETGEQAARALHSSQENECCFHVCSEEEPGSGICANCTDREPQERGRSRDPPTAPHCEINPIHTLPTGQQQYPILQSAESSTESSSEGPEGSSVSPAPSLLMHPQQGASLCGSGGVGSMTASSSSRVTSSPSLVLWLASLFLLFFSQLRCATSTLRRRLPTLQTCGVSGRPGARRDAESSSSRMGGLLKWVMIECRCRGWWWCWWWWWRSTSGPSGHGRDDRASSSSRCWSWWLWYRWRTRRKCAQPAPRRPRGRRKGGRPHRKSQGKTTGGGIDGRAAGLVRRREYLRLSSRQDPP